MSLSGPRLRLLVTALVAGAVVLAVLLLVNRMPEQSARPSGAGVTPASSNATAARVRGLETQVRRGGRRAQTYAALGTAYLQRLRETGDSGLEQRVQRAFQRALAREPRNLEATVGLGTLALSRHDFRRGLRYGERARRIGPASFAPFAVLVDAQIELGRYRDAERTLGQMVAFKPSVASYARVSYFRELHGDMDGALDAMALAVAAAPATGENRAYVQSLLGDLRFERGQVRKAAESYRAALAAFPAHADSDAGLARAEAAQGRLGAAVDRLRGVAARRPDPAYLIPLGEAELAAGRRTAARQTFDKVRALIRSELARGFDPDAEMASFEADHGSPRRAVEIGRDVYARAPSVDAADALGWALTRAGRPADGLAYVRRALALGSRDPLFLYHAGIAARDAGMPALARTYLSRALAANPRFSPLHGPRAERAARRLS